MAAKEVAVECPVCLQFFEIQGERVPLLLDCNHTLCKVCASEIAKNDVTASSVVCPLCREQSPLAKPNEVDRLCVNQAVLGVLQQLEKHHRHHQQQQSQQQQQTQQKLVALCDNCSDHTSKRADVRCEKCTANLCRDCFTKIHSIKALQNHSASVVANSNTAKCEQHNKELELYCYTCCKLVCFGCHLRSCKTHSVELVGEAVHKQQHALQDSVQSLCNEKQHITAHINQVGDLITECKCNLDTTTQSIKDTMRRLHEAINKREKEVLDFVHEQGKVKLKALGLHKDHLNMILNCINQLTTLCHSITRIAPQQQMANTSSVEAVSAGCTYSDGEFVRVCSDCASQATSVASHSTELRGMQVLSMFDEQSPLIVPTTSLDKMQLEYNSLVQDIQTLCAIETLSSDEKKLKAIPGILNKLKPSLPVKQVDKLTQQILDLELNSHVLVEGVIDLLYNKAVMEPHFVRIISDVCFRVSASIESDTQPFTPVSLAAEGSVLDFRRMLLNKCQAEFENQQSAGAGLVGLTGDEREIKRQKMQQQRIGNVQFIGELYKKKMLQERIMHVCIRMLLGSETEGVIGEEDIEVLCKLMITIGKTFEPSNQREVAQYFDRLLQLKNKPDFLSPRVQFMIQDLGELRKRRWAPRQEDLKPKTITEIHQETEREKARDDRRQQIPPGTRRPDGGSGRRDQPQSFRDPRQAPRSNDVQMTLQQLEHQRQHDWEAGISAKGSVSTREGMFVRGELGKPKKPKHLFEGLLEEDNDDNRQRNKQQQQQQKQQQTQPRQQCANSPAPDEFQEKVKETIQHILGEYFRTFEKEEALTCFTQLPHTGHARFVQTAIEFAVESNKAEKIEKFVVLLDLALKLGLSAESINKGVEDFLACLSDLAVDVPKAPHLTGIFFGFAVVRDILSLTSVVLSLNAFSAEPFAVNVLSETLTTLQNDPDSSYPSLLTPDAKSAITSFLTVSGKDVAEFLQKHHAEASF